LVSLDDLEFTAMTSRLTMLEALVFPLRNGDLTSERNFRTFLTPSPNKKIEPVNVAACLNASTQNFGG